MDELEQLRSENASLRHELDAALSKLNSQELRHKRETDILIAQRDVMHDEICRWARYMQPALAVHFGKSPVVFEKVGCALPLINPSKTSISGAN